MDEVNEPYANVPDNMRSLFEEVGLIDPEVLDEDANAMLEPARLGLCMTCGAELGPNIVVLINTKGICGVYCGGACCQDMAVLGWIQEQHDDVVDRVKFRGGQADAADEG